MRSTRRRSPTSSLIALRASAVSSRRSSAARADVTPADFPNNSGGRQNDSIDLSVAMSVDVPLTADGKSSSLVF